MKFDNKTFQQKYEAWKNGADYWKDIRGINLGGDSWVDEPTPEEQEQMNAKVQSILNEYNAGKEINDSLPQYWKGKKGRFVNTAKSFYNELVAGGVDPIVAAGIAGNVQQESSFNPDSVSASGTYRGYAQLNPGLVNYVRQAYGGYGHRHQMQFLIDMAKGTPRKVKGSKVYADMLSRSKSFRGETYTTPQAAANGWEVYFEKSGGQNMKKRLKYAGDIYNSYYKPKKTVIPTIANQDLQQYSPIVMNSPSTKEESTINAVAPISLIGPNGEDPQEQYQKLRNKTFDLITTPTPLPNAITNMLQGNNFGKDSYGQKFWQRRGANLHFKNGLATFTTGSDDENNIGGDIAKKLGAGPIGQDVANFGAQMIPGYGAYLDIKNATENPSWSSIGTAALTTAGDIFTLGFGGLALRAGLRAAKAAAEYRKAKKAYDASKALTPGTRQVTRSLKIVGDAANKSRSAREKANAVNRVRNSIKAEVATHITDAKDGTERVVKHLNKK